VLPRYCGARVASEMVAPPQRPDSLRRDRFLIP